MVNINSNLCGKYDSNKQTSYYTFVLNAGDKQIYHKVR